MAGGRPSEKKENCLSEDEFFTEISARANYLPPETIRQVYYAMVKLLVAEVKTHGRVIMPDLGTLLLKYSKSRRSININTGKIEVLPEKKSLKLQPDHKLKRYFNQK